MYANNCLARSYPDKYWSDRNDIVEPGFGPISEINNGHRLELVNESAIRDQGPVVGMTLSPDGSILATFCLLGCVKLWDTSNYELLGQLRDNSEPNIDEFYCGQFLLDDDNNAQSNPKPSPTRVLLAVGGKLKDRKRWSEADEDNHILPCPVKIFDVSTSEVVGQLGGKPAFRLPNGLAASNGGVNNNGSSDGHLEEVLCIKKVVYKGERYIVSTSQDGYIIRWKMASDWSTLIEKRTMLDGITCMAFTVSFVPGTGNRFFIAACDDTLKLFDFEQGRMVHAFNPIYSSYCDCAKVRKSAYLISRGVELLDAEDNTVATRPNTCTLHRLEYPSESNGGRFVLSEVRRFSHPEYVSNSWLIKVTSNGRYILAPTYNGQVFVFSLSTGELTTVLRGDHEEIELLFILVISVGMNTANDGEIECRWGF
ncbi:WD40 repeat-like protein [Ramicandelaber brevisporus]|nr:WD40 repeat-like protein [Ramicandelaber brevisporus]